MWVRLPTSHRSPLLFNVLVSVEQLDGWRKTVSDKVVYVTKDSSGQLRVLSAICPHLGCSVQWVGHEAVRLSVSWRIVFRPTAHARAAPLPGRWTRWKAQCKAIVWWSATAISGSWFPDKQIIG